MLCYSRHQTLGPCRSGNGKAFVFLRFNGTVLHRVIFLPQQPSHFFSLSAFAVAAAGVQQRWEGGFCMGSGWEIQSWSWNWPGTGHQILCSASVLWEGMEAPVSQGVLLGQFWALGIKAILPLYCCVFVGEKTLEEHRLACLRLGVQWSFSALSITADSIPKLGWVSPIVKRHEQQYIHPQALQLFGNPCNAVWFWIPFLSSSNEGGVHLFRYRAITFLSLLLLLSIIRCALYLGI